MKNHLTTAYKEIVDKVSIRGIIFVVLCLLCFIEIVSLVGGVHQMLTEGRMHMREVHSVAQKYTDITTPEEIEAWMTFSYINFIFKLPDSYLVDKLAITDAKYPKIQIMRYARHTHQDVTTVLEKVRQAVRDARK